MTGWAVDVRCPAPRRDHVAAWLVARTGQAVHEQDQGLLTAWTETPTGAEALRLALRDAFGDALGTAMREVPAVDWSVRWRDGIGARRFGRLVLTPSWIEPDCEPGDVVLVIDPESASGTGEHGSTRAALHLLTQYLRPGDRLLDLGSGSGILALAAARLGAARVLGIELDPEAVVVAERNAERNGLAASVGFVAGDAADLAPLAAPVDFVVSNILRLPNLELLPVIRDALRTGGVVTFSGMEVEEAELFRPHFVDRGFRILSEIVDSGWWAIAGARV